MDTVTHPKKYCPEMSYQKSYKQWLSFFRIEGDKIISLVAYPKNFITPHGNKQICQSHTENHQIQKSINFTISEMHIL